MRIIHGISLLIAILAFNPLFAQNGKNKVKLLFFGDVMQHKPQMYAAFDKTTNSYIYDSCFKYVKPWFSKADFVVGNLEFTLAGEPYSGYPLFSGPDEVVHALKRAGVNVLVTANNHSCDRDLTGITRTLDILDQTGISYTGTFRSKKEKLETEPLLMVKNGLRLAFLSYTYDTNGRKIPAGTAVNVIDTVQMAKDIARSKSQNPDEIIVFIHWGIEYAREPSFAQKRIEKFLNRQGVRIIIGSHPHVVQPIVAKIQNNSIQNLTVYSMGNFVSNQRKRFTDGGIMFYVELTKQGDKVEIENPGYIPTWVKLRNGAGLSSYQILPVADFENKNEFFWPAEWAKFDLYKKDVRQWLDSLNKNVPEIKSLQTSGFSWIPLKLGN